MVGAGTEHGAGLGPDRAYVEPRATGWQVLTFVCVAMGWAPLSLIAWLAAMVGTVGWSLDGSGGLDDGDPGSSSSVIAVVLAAGLFVLGGVVLVALARWAMPGTRRIGTALGVVGLVWAPVLATVWTVVR